MAEKSGTPYRDSLKRAARRMGIHNGKRAKRAAKKVVRVTHKGLKRMKRITI
jgi:hypothetical protein